MNYCASAAVIQSRDTRQYSLIKSIVGKLTDNYTVIRLNISSEYKEKNISNTETALENKVLQN